LLQLKYAPSVGSRPEQQLSRSRRTAWSKCGTHA